MKNKILSEMNGQMNSLRAKEIAFVEKAMKAKTVAIAKKWMEKAVKASEEYKQLVHKYHTYVECFYRYEEDGSFYR
jgi:hypothetical protein